MRSKGICNHYHDTSPILVITPTAYIYIYIYLVNEGFDCCSVHVPSTEYYISATCDKKDGKRDLYVAATRISPGSPINGTLKLNRELFLNDLIRCLFLPT